MVMDRKDNVATVIGKVPKGAQVELLAGRKRSRMTVKQGIKFGHKIAIKSIAPGDTIWKYGYSIGRATQAIKPGEHVHIHNIESNRGRGDLQAKD